METLLEVLELEAEDRQQRRTTRLRRASRLAPGKTWDTFQHQRLPARLQQQLGELAQGEFIEQGTNVLAFGLPGTGKTHALCALGHRLVETGYSVLFTPAYRLVQELLAAQRDLQLPRALRKLDNFDFLVLDDLGYLPQGARGVGGTVHTDGRAPLVAAGALRVAPGPRGRSIAVDEPVDQHEQEPSESRKSR